MVQHIGIVACSAEGAALCYRTICVEGAALMGPHAHPEVSMHTPSLADYVAHLDRNDWPAVGELMLASAHKLAKMGADFLICPDNTIHQALPHVLPKSPLPWLHIAEVAARALRDGDLAGRALELTGPQSLTHGEQVAVLGAVLGRSVRFEEVPPETAARQMVARGMPEPFVTALMARYARHVDRPQHPPTDTVEKVLGRPARTFAQWIAEHRGAF